MTKLSSLSKGLRTIEKRRIHLLRRGESNLSEHLNLLDICPNETCYAVPFVRDPQQRLFCVICERTYMTEAAYNKQMQNHSSAGSSLTATAAKTNTQPTPVTTQVSGIFFPMLMIAKPFYEQSIVDDFNCFYLT
jgi:hypothetical protein